MYIFFIYIRIDLYILIYVYIYTLICWYTFFDLHIFLHTYRLIMFISLDMHPIFCVFYINTYIHKYIHTYIQTLDLYTCVFFMCVCKYLYTYVYLHTFFIYLYMYIYTFICWYTYFDLHIFIYTHRLIIFMSLDMHYIFCVF